MIDLTGKTILIIDDEQPTREVLSDILESMGARTITAEDGVAGIDSFTKNHQEVSLAIIDLTMPMMNGADVARKLKDVDARIRIILSSGYPEDEVRRKYGPVECNGFIQKPFRPAAFLDLVQRAIS
jgi:two-component system cell cycle sensor histidine kinase/response regulator CckA